MKFSILTIFPQMLDSYLKLGLVGQAAEKGLLEFEFFDLRTFVENNYKSIDDRPFGGGDGMVMQAEPIKAAIEKAKEKTLNKKNFVVCLSAQGKKLNQKMVHELGKYENLILLCGRYAGVDQRVLNDAVDLELSIGDYVLNGGESAALVLIDAVSRTVPGVLGNTDSLKYDSFENGLLEGPVFTRPREILGQGVPEILLCGDHNKIKKWKDSLALVVTAIRRPDLLVGLPQKEVASAVQEISKLNEGELKACGIKSKELKGLSQQSLGSEL